MYLNPPPNKNFLRFKWPWSVLLYLSWLWSTLLPRRVSLGSGGPEGRSICLYLTTRESGETAFHCCWLFLVTLVFNFNIKDPLQRGGSTSLLGFSLKQEVNPPPKKGFLRFRWPWSVLLYLFWLWSTLLPRRVSLGSGGPEGRSISLYLK